MENNNSTRFLAKSHSIRVQVFLLCSSEEVASQLSQASQEEKTEVEGCLEGSYGFTILVFKFVSQVHQFVIH